MTPTKHGWAPTSADLLLDETARYPVLTAAQELVIATRAAAGSRAARHRLVLHNLRFAHYVAWQYRFTGLPQDDVLSAVCAGMRTAGARFDPTRGVHFVTYATPLIRTAVRLLVVKAGAPLSLPHARTFAALGETSSLSFDVPMRAGGRTNGTPYTLADVIPDGRPAIDDVVARDHAAENLAKKIATSPAVPRCRTGLTLGLGGGVAVVGGKAQGAPAAIVGFGLTCR